MKAFATRRSAIGWLLPGVLAIAVLGASVRGGFAVRDRFVKLYQLEAIENEQAALAVLYPFYLQLQREMADEKESDFSGYPSLETLRVEDLPSLSESLHQMVSEQGMTVADIGFQVKAENEHRLLLVTLPLRGRYRQVGGVLAAVIQMPSLLSVDRFSAVWGEGSDEIELVFQLAME